LRATGCGIARSCTTGAPVRLILSLCILSAVATTVCGAGADRLDGQALYLGQCSNCHGVLKVSDNGRGDALADSVSIRLAVALPYGPTLNGVLGREAGTVSGYQYSRAFLEALRGVVWTRPTLDRWITDTRAWVPGSVMVYRQPDPGIRAAIVDYLERATAEPSSPRALPTGGGETGADALMTSSSIGW
jgi:cytochrome c